MGPPGPPGPAPAAPPGTHTSSWGQRGPLATTRGQNAVPRAKRPPEPPAEPPAMLTAPAAPRWCPVPAETPGTAPAQRPRTPPHPRAAPAPGRTHPGTPTEVWGPQTGLGDSPSPPQHRAGRGCAPGIGGLGQPPKAAPPCSGPPPSRAFVSGTIRAGGAAPGAAERARSAPGAGGAPRDPQRAPPGPGAAGGGAAPRSRCHPRRPRDGSAAPPPRRETGEVRGARAGWGAPGAGEARGAQPGGFGDPPVEEKRDGGSAAPGSGPAGSGSGSGGGRERFKGAPRAPGGSRQDPTPPGPEGSTYLSCHRCLRCGRPDGGLPAGRGARAGTDGHGRARTDTGPPPGTPHIPGGAPPRPRPRRSHKWRGAAAAAALARPGDPPCGSQLAQVPRKVEPGPGRGGGDGLTLGRPPCPAPHPRGRPAGAAALSEPPFGSGGDAGTPPGWERSGGSEQAEPPPLHPALPALRGAEAAPAHPRAPGRLRPAGRARARLSPGRRFLPLGGHFYSRGRPAPGPPSGPLTGCRTPEPRT
ncbi:translation initiation factor IF-2-like [Melozone crissalis]|uniref:translation initiation factor IF-2-like n=1 Tax=Melozone crissalis TaxID=40204 RepID=UPI0023DA3247|nr:translation initiation factor IF-2-like [Melozone crissalis]